MSRYRVISSGQRWKQFTAVYKTLALAVILSATATIQAGQSANDSWTVPGLHGRQASLNGRTIFSGRPLPPRHLNPVAAVPQQGVHTDGTGQGAGPITVSVLQNFEPPDWQGSFPLGGLLRGEDGSFYGATSTGGLGFGVVYQIDHAGTERVLYKFTGGADGSHPAGTLVSDPAGNLYGATSGGGNFGPICGPVGGCGVIFRLDKTGKESVLYTFLGGADGAHPQSVVRDSTGNLFGFNFNPVVIPFFRPEGAVFKVDPSGNETVLHNFTGQADGGRPQGSLIVDQDGILYGTTSEGGIRTFFADGGGGLVFKMDQAGNETVLYNFTGGPDGETPEANLIFDSSGNLYSTTHNGGANSYGVIFKLDKAGNETVLYSLKGGDDGIGLYAGVVRDEEGNLYSTAAFGGAYGNGVVFKLSKSGVYTVLHAFQGAISDGSQPGGGVTLDSEGNISGVTNYGGPADFGVVYTLDKTGKEITKYAFPTPVNGSDPNGGVIASSVGDLFGTTYYGGLYNQGVVYKLDFWGNETALYRFTGGADGGAPNGVIQDSSGNLYGTTFSGGDPTGCPFGWSSGCGVIFKVDSAGKETTLHSFSAADGYEPQGNLVRDLKGNLYGATYRGGNLSTCYGGGCGDIFKLDESGKLTVLYAFKGEADGANPNGNLILDSEGNLYGTTQAGGALNSGVIFKVDASGHETLLHSFLGGTDGDSPGAGMVRDHAGNLFGTTSAGGASNAGVVFKLDANGIETVMYSFTGLADGDSPNSSLVLDSAGNLYGTTSSGGDFSACNGSGCGVVFQVTPSGMETPLYTFTGAAFYGTGTLLLDASGDLWEAAAGGTEGGGVVFKIQQ